MLIKLMKGVLKFKGHPFHKRQNLFEHLINGQSPDTLFITCSDSRIIPTLIVQAGLGELFVVRNAGNIVPPSDIPSSEAAAIEYAVKNLGIKDIIICGHSHCGAMKGLLTENLEEQLPIVAHWLHHSHSELSEADKATIYSINNPQKKLDKTIKINILKQMEHLKTYSFVQERIANNKIAIHGWIYDIGSGDIAVYEPECQDFIAVETALVHAVELRMKQIVEDAARNYLKEHVQPEGQCIDTSALWHYIKEPVREHLWNDLAHLYDSKEDPEFIALLDKGKQIQLKKIATPAPSSIKHSATKEENRIKTDNSPSLNMHIISGFIAALGYTAVALAFTALNAVTLGIPGLIVACLGMAGMLGSLGLFTYKRAQSTLNELSDNEAFKMSLLS